MNGKLNRVNRVSALYSALIFPRLRRAQVFTEQIGDCRVLCTLRHPLTFRESIYFQKLRAPHVLRTSFKLERVTLPGEPRTYPNIDKFM